MQQKTSRAQAYDKLSHLTAQADLAATTAFDWTKLVRAIEHLAQDLKLNISTPDDTYLQLESFHTFASKERNAMRDLATRKQSQCVELNEQLQNGVFDE